MDSGEKSYKALQDELSELKKAYDSLKQERDNGLNTLKLAEDRARFSEDKFMKAFFTSPDSVNINRLSDGMYVSANKGFVTMLGYSEEEVIGKTSIELNIWADPDNRKKLVDLLNQNGRVENFEALFRHKDGHKVIGLMSASVIELDGIPHILNITKDITGRKRIEEALLREQFLISSLMDNIPDHVYFKDLESRFIRINKSHAESFGLNDARDAIGKSDFDFFSSEHARAAYEDEQKIILTGEVIVKAEKLTWEDKAPKWSSSVKLPLRDLNGKIIGTFGISRDITDQRKAEEQYYLLACALRGINECVSITDMNDKVLFLNQAFTRTYGFVEDDLKEENINLIRSPNNSEVIAAEILPETLKGGWHGELLNRKKDGSEFLVSLSTAVVKDPEGEPFALIGVASDITERKRIETENKIIYEITRGISTTSNLDELLKLIHKSLGKVIYAENCFVALHDKKTELFSFPYFIDKFDTTPSPTAMGKSCTAYVFRTLKPLLLTQEIFNKLAEENEVELVGSPSPSWIGIPLQTPSKVIGVMVLQHYEKENVYSENDVRFLMSIGGQIAFSIERKLAEEEIKLKNDLLQAINAEKDKFFSIIAHDLRGPMSSFVEVTKILADDIQAMKLEEIRDIVTGMRDDSANIYSLLENLLEWSRLKRGVMEFNPVKIQLAAVIQTTINILSASANAKSIKLISSVPDNLFITADKHMIETVIRNLISNAVKFTGSGGSVILSANQLPGTTTEISIADTGIGMSPDLKSKLFHINEKTSRPGTAGETSTGLGLLLCKEFVEKHNGRIWVESEEGKGSVFSFSLPFLT